MRLRAAAGLAALALALTASPGSAAPLRFADPPGDGPAKQTSFDIVWVEFTTTGTGKGAKYVPWDLLVTMRLNNVPLSVPGARYVVQGEVAGCRTFELTYTPMGSAMLFSPAQFSGSCEQGDPIESELRFEISGSSLKWRLPISQLPVGMRVGATYTGLRAFAEIGDPYLGGTGSVARSEAAADVAQTATPWVLR